MILLSGLDSGALPSLSIASALFPEAGDNGVEDGITHTRTAVWQLKFSRLELVMLPQGLRPPVLAHPENRTHRACSSKLFSEPPLLLQELSKEVRVGSGWEGCNGTKNSD